jgi:hypothetical protein
MEHQAHISLKETPRPHTWAQGFLRAWQILRDVLRGYCAGQPINESRPRKGCC